MTTPEPDRLITRRGLLLGSAAVAGLAAVTGCVSSAKGPSPTSLPPGTSSLVPPTNAVGSVTTVSPSASSITASVAEATYVNHGPRTGKQMSLTFHLSGDRKVVVRLLDLLKAANVSVTVMAVGSWITDNADIGRRVVADGHELGNHTQHHLNMGGLDRATIFKEIVDGGQSLVPFIGSIGRWFRPSAIDVPTHKILQETKHAGYAVSLGYDVDSKDNHDPGSAAVVANVKAGVQAGSIVSHHFGHPGTITAMPKILDHLASVGLKPVTVGTLLGP